MSTELGYVTSGVHGKHGADGARGKDGQGAGGDGSCGKPAQHGQRGVDAGPVLLSIVPDGNKINIEGHAVYKGNTEKKGIKGLLALGDPKSHVILAAVGGNGGSGGKGGRGGDGARGYRGRDATSYSSGTNGGPGGDGGHGGDGGRGGDGGHGANIDVHVADADLDTLMIIEAPPATNAGTGGGGGAGGRGGDGGPGGQGGSSYSWTTQSRNSDGSYTTHYHSNPGGYNGPSGTGGKGGKGGAKGKNGVNGTFTIHVEGLGSGKHDSDSSVSTRPWRYDFAVARPAYEDEHKFGVYEPGAHVYLWTDVKNTGPMITPRQDLMVTVYNTKEMAAREVYRHNRRIAETSQWQYTDKERTDACTFQLAEWPASAGPPLAYDTHTIHRLVVDRVMKDSIPVSKQKTPIHIRRPIEASRIIGVDSIAMGEEATLVFQVRNVSQRPIGVESQSGRGCSVWLQIVKPDGATDCIHADVVAFSTTEGEDYDENFREEVELGANKTTEFSCTLRFTDVWTKPYSLAHVQLCVDLGRIQNPVSWGTDRAIIQYRPFQVQLAERYTATPSSGVLLVVNRLTPRHCVDFFKELLTFCGGELSTWNISMYEGFDLDHRPGGSQKARTLREEWSGKNIIFLNNSLTHGEYDQRMRSPLTMICPAALQQLRLYSNIHTCLLGLTQFPIVRESSLNTIAGEPLILKDKACVFKMMTLADTVDDHNHDHVPSFHGVDVMGFLEKRSGGMRKQYQVRFFVLRREKGTLSYYHAVTDRKPIHVLYMRDAVEVKESTESDNRAAKCEVVFPDRTFCFWYSKSSIKANEAHKIKAPENIDAWRALITEAIPKKFETPQDEAPVEAKSTLDVDATSKRKVDDFHPDVVGLDEGSDSDSDPQPEVVDDGFDEEFLGVDIKVLPDYMKGIAAVSHSTSGKSPLFKGSIKTGKKVTIILKRVPGCTGFTVCSEKGDPVLDLRRYIVTYDDDGKTPVCSVVHPYGHLKLSASSGALTARNWYDALAERAPTTDDHASNPFDVKENGLLPAGYRYPYSNFGTLDRCAMYYVQEKTVRWGKHDPKNVEEEANELATQLQRALPLSRFTVMHDTYQVPIKSKSWMVATHIIGEVSVVYNGPRLHQAWTVAEVGDADLHADHTTRPVEIDRRQQFFFFCSLRMEQALNVLCALSKPRGALDYSAGGPQDLQPTMKQAILACLAREQIILRGSTKDGPLNAKIIREAFLPLLNTVADFNFMYCPNTTGREGLVATLIEIYCEMKVLIDKAEAASDVMLRRRGNSVTNASARILQRLLKTIFFSAGAHTGSEQDRIKRPIKDVYTAVSNACAKLNSDQCLLRLAFPIQHCPEAAGFKSIQDAKVLFANSVIHKAEFQRVRERLKPSGHPIKDGANRFEESKLRTDTATRFRSNTDWSKQYA